MSFWHRRDPRSKLILALGGSLAVSVAPPERVLAALPLLVVLVLTARLPARPLHHLFRGILVLWGLSFLANAFLIPGIRMGPEVLAWARPTVEGVRAGLVQGGRLAALAMLSAWVVGTTGALDLAASLEWTVRGLPRLRRRAHRALFPMVLSLRILPLFLEEASRLLDVDRLREGPRRGWAGVRRVARLAPLWVVMVVERAEALALALTLRGYRPDGTRGFARGYRFGPVDWGLVALTAAGSWALRLP